MPKQTEINRDEKRKTTNNCQVELSKPVNPELSCETGVLYSICVKIDTWLDEMESKPAAKINE